MAPMTAILSDFGKSLEINGVFYKVKSYDDYIIRLDTDYKKEREIGGVFLMSLVTLHIK